MEITGTLVQSNKTDKDGNPAGGLATAVGVDIRWQDGPLGVHGDNRKMPTGAFIGDVLSAVIGRLEFFQGSKYACRENAIALTHIETALLWLKKRTEDREARGVEGTYQL